MGRSVSKAFPQGPQARRDAGGKTLMALAVLLSLWLGNYLGCRGFVMEVEQTFRA